MIRTVELESIRSHSVNEKKRQQEGPDSKNNFKKKNKGIARKELKAHRLSEASTAPRVAWSNFSAAATGAGPFAGHFVGPQPSARCSKKAEPGRSSNTPTNAKVGAATPSLVAEPACGNAEKPAACGTDQHARANRFVSSSNGMYNGAREHT